MPTRAPPNAQFHTNITNINNNTIVYCFPAARRRHCQHADAILPYRHIVTRLFHQPSADESTPLMPPRRRYKIIRHFIVLPRDTNPREQLTTR